MFRPSTLRAAVLTAVALAATAAPSQAQVFRTNGGFESNILGGNDDGSTGSVAIGFSANFFGTTYNNLFVNNNGNVTFNGPLGTFTPFSLLSTSTPIIAPFFADVDTRPAASEDVTYGIDTVGGRDAFGVNWENVGFFANQTNRLNTFQLVLIDRADTGAGNFDFEFNYEQIQWETGQASGGNANGLGGSSARAGFSNGVDTSFELPGSAINGAFLDGGPNALIRSSNIGVPGRWLFSVRNGNVVSTATPVPATAVAALLGVLGLVPVARRRAKATV